MFLSSGILQSPVGTWFQGIRVDLGIDSGRRNFLQVPPPFGPSWCDLGIRPQRISSKLRTCQVVSSKPFPRPEIAPLWQGELSIKSFDSSAAWLSQG